MRRKQLWKALGAGMLALSLVISPLGGATAKATGAEGINPEGGRKEDIDPTRTEEIPAVGTEGEAGYVPAVPAYEDVKIPVYGFTGEGGTVYSVDVEWGAMTFQWESSSWDPRTHMSVASSGWKVYDSENEVALDETEHSINEIKITNHSNAGILADLSYVSEPQYVSTTGSFTIAAETEDQETPSMPATGMVNLRLGSADNDEGEGEGVGKETVGTAYFMPSGLYLDSLPDHKIEKWTKIGTITVEIKTEDPAGPAGPVVP